MEKLINKVYDNKMNDGTFEKIVSEEFEKMVKAACSDIFGYNSETRDLMKNKIKGLMNPIIEKSDFNEFTVKMQAVINEIIRSSSLGDYKEMLDNIKDLCGIKEVKFQQKIKISEILENYCKYLEDQLSECDFDDDEINTDDGTKNAYLECHVEVEDLEKEASYFYSTRDKKIVRLTHDKEQGHEKTIIEFELIKDSKGKWGVHIDSNFIVSDLRYLPSFIVYLLSLEQNFAEIIIDTEYDSMEIDFEFEWN